jgi:hypothetical protein
VVLMDQPFAALVKELFDIQKYPNLPGMPQPAARGRRWRRGGGAEAGAPAAAPAAALLLRRSSGGRAVAVEAVGVAAEAAPGGAGRRARRPAHADAIRRDRLDAAHSDGRRSGRGDAAGERCHARTLHKIDRVEPIAGKVEGSGPVFAFSHKQRGAARGE